MNGLCGICHPGRRLDAGALEPMLSALDAGGHASHAMSAGLSIAMGTSQVWPGQGVAQIPGIHIAIDTDLYNASELLAYLNEKGLDASGFSLALTLAHLYRLDGPDFLLRLHGAYSIALWDETNQRFLLAIDRLGVKSLYWTREKDRLLFATRLGSIRAVLESPLELNPAALPQYFLFSVIPHPMTIYRGVEKLEPATCLIYEKNEIRKVRYWDLNYVESDGQGEAQWALEVQNAMRAAVHRHLDGCAADNVGAYLSGGTDSSSVVAFMSERCQPVNTFSIFFGEAEYSEINFARTTAAHFRTRHFEKQISANDALEAIPKIAKYYEEPFANSSAFGAYYCAALAREAGVQTMLGGDGGDELFAGNSRYAEDKRFALYHSVPSWLRRGMIEPVTRLFPENDGHLSLPGKYVRRASIPNPRRIFSYNFLLNVPPQEIFEPDVLAAAQPDRWMEIADAHFHSPQTGSELNRLMHMDVKMILADNDLRKVTGTAEIAGMRVRYPLLDDRLAEFAARIPSRLKLKGFKKRYIFKKAMQSLLPQAVLYKKKHGFGVPVSRWLLQDPQLHGLMKDVLGDSRTRQRGYFRPGFIENVLRLHREGHVGFYGEVVWYLLALELWHRHHFDHGVRVPNVE